MKRIITFATLFALTACDSKPSNIIVKVDCEAQITLDSKLYILKYSKTDYTNGTVRATGSILTTNSEHTVMKYHEVGTSGAALGRVLVKTDLDSFIGFTISGTHYHFDKNDQLALENRPWLVIEYPNGDGLTTKAEDVCSVRVGDKINE
jgi:hypothetical protein